MSVEILKRTVKTPILQIAPETDRLPEDMGDLARYISGKSGGLGEAVAALTDHWLSTLKRRGMGE